jgi:hypothetical protein
MSEEDNPYRFTGGAPEEPTTASEIRRRLTLGELRSISRGRRYLAALSGTICGCCATFLFVHYLFWAHGKSVQGVPNSTSLLHDVAGILCLIAVVGLYVVGTKMIPLLDRRVAWLESIGLLSPGTNVFLALLLIRDAKRTLLRHNVRLGWLKDDFSQADAERSFWRPSAL